MSPDEIITAHVQATQEFPNAKTIRMPKEILAKWLAALRSGEFKQGRSMLYIQVTDSYCCLGVLQKVCGEVELSEPCPSHRWLQDHGVTFTGRGELEKAAQP